MWGPLEPRSPVELDGIDHIMDVKVHTHTHSAERLLWSSCCPEYFSPFELLIVATFFNSCALDVGGKQTSQVRLFTSLWPKYPPIAVRHSCTFMLNTEWNHPSSGLSRFQLEAAHTSNNLTHNLFHSIWRRKKNLIVEASAFEVLYKKIKERVKRIRGKNMFPLQDYGTVQAESR